MGSESPKDDHKRKNLIETTENLFVLHTYDHPLKFWTTSARLAAEALAGRLTSLILRGFESWYDF